ncbi:MAG: hypothetical protein VR72_03770 [Clostridiaceae bacterium BRH_c20a]|nr:MAG: hypothetical protein VR72_03770 [Clostridiaceae bacterium BRH_c20a]
MNFTRFKKEVIKRKRYLTSDKNITFNKYFEESKKNERLRNNFVFYVLSNKYYYHKFKNLTEKDATANEMYQNLYNALTSTHDEGNEIKETSNMLLRKYFSSVAPRKRFLRAFKRNEVSEDMKKYLRTLVNQVRFEDNYSKEDEDYFKKLLAKKHTKNLLTKK